MVSRIVAGVGMALAAALVAALPAHALTRDPLEANGLGSAANALTAQAAVVPPGFTEDRLQRPERADRRALRGRRPRRRRREGRAGQALRQPLGHHAHG